MLSTFEILTLTDKQKTDGVWLSGVYNEGEFKQWGKNGNFLEHSFWKNGERVGEYKLYHENGQLWMVAFYKEGHLHGECKLWDKSGKLYSHTLHENGKRIKDYLEK